MKVAIVYHSVYRKQTEVIARAMAEVVQGDLMTVPEAMARSMEEYDLIGFGSGVYKENLAPSLFRLADQMDFAGKRVFVFSTSGMGTKLYHRTLIRVLEKKGADVAGNFACRGSFTPSEFTSTNCFNLLTGWAKGHPDAKDIDRARKFISGICNS